MFVDDFICYCILYSVLMLHTSILCLLKRELLVAPSFPLTHPIYTIQSGALRGRGGVARSSSLLKVNLEALLILMKHLFSAYLKLKPSP